MYIASDLIILFLPINRNVYEQNYDLVHMSTDTIGHLNQVVLSVQDRKTD